MPSPESSDEEIRLAVCQQYFRERELAEARRMIEAGLAYEDALAYLATSAEDDLRTSGEQPYWFFTIPSGKVFIYQPGHGFPERPISTVSARYLASQALPISEQRKHALAEEVAPAQKRQLSFWDASEIEERDAAGQRPPQETHREKRARPKKLTYGEQRISLKYGPPTQGWVVKDRGLGYLVEPMPSRDIYWIKLIHLGSGREMAAVMSKVLDHERIRTWVSACALLTDWTRGIQAVLAEQQEKPKHQAWSRQLEAIWRDQKQIKRQLALF